MLSRIYLLQDIEKRVKPTIKQFPIHAQVSDIYRKLIKTFDEKNCSTNKVKEILRYLVYYHHWPSKRDKEVYEFLKKKRIMVQKRITNEIKEYVLICSPQMKRNYLKYGECLNIDFEFVPLKRAQNLKSYYVGIFSGEDEFEEKVIFSVCLVNSTKQSSYMMVILQFFQLMPKPPITVISSNNPSIRRILEILQFQYGFRLFINWYYKFKEYQKTFFSQKRFNKLKNLLQLAMSTFNHKKYHKYIQKMKNKIQIMANNFNIEQIFSNSEKFCFCKSVPSFLGFCIEGRKVQELVKSIDKNYPYCQNLGVFIQRSLKLTEEFQRKERIISSNMNSEAVQNEQKYLQQKLSSSIYEKFFFQLRQARNNTQLIKVSDLLFQASKLNEQSQNPKIKVEYSLSKSCWVCQCNYIFFSGLPCSHLLKVLQEFSGSYLYYINSRWIVN